MTAQILSFPNAASRNNAASAFQPRYFTGWWLAKCTANGESHERFEAYVRPDSADWYGVYPADSAEHAAALAVDLAAAQADAVYEGGPDNG